MIVTRYLIREITTVFLIVSTTLILIYNGYSISSILANPSSNSLQPIIVLHLILLEQVRVIDLILATALYMSVILALSRLYRDSEMVALMASGYSELQVLRAVFYFTLVIALVTGLFSIVGRPWAYRMIYNLEEMSMDKLDIKNIQPRVFTELKNSNSLLYADSVDSSSDRLSKVMLQSNAGMGKRRVITANSMSLINRGNDSLKPVEFENGHLYMIDREGQNDSMLKFETLAVYLKGEGSAMGHERKGIETQKLLEATRPKEIAELQWRLGSPLATILLALLGIPLSRNQLGKRRSSRVIAAILMYTLFFNLMGIARSWVDHGHVAAIPGIWWVHILCGIIFFALYLQPRFAVYKARW
jgi:lipopolysaccharide export system permease protein